MKTYHILNGDCLAEQIKQTDIQGEFIVCRECLIDGEVNAGTIDEFWNIRARYIAEVFNVSEESYFRKTVSEFKKLTTLPDNAEICLWFENDLFCQTNMWFILSLIFAKLSTAKVYRIFPEVNNTTDRWKGFGISDAQMLERAYSNKMEFTPKDIRLGNDLWNVYKTNNYSKLFELSHTVSNCFQSLTEVCQANIDRFPGDKELGRPERAVNEIMNTKWKEFNDVFAEFSNTQGIYGFGDLQVKRIYDRQIKSYK